jgi:hypothetical protein
MSVLRGTVLAPTTQVGRRTWKLSLLTSPTPFNLQPSFSHRFHRFGFFGGDGLDDQDVTIIQQFQPAPTTEPSEPAENRIYVPPHWVDGAYGVQVLQPGYWTVPKQAAEH